MLPTHYCISVCHVILLIAVNCLTFVMVFFYIVVLVSNQLRKCYLSKAMF